MKPRQKDADEQSGQKYQMHDSYLITEISQYQHINAVNCSRPIVAGEVPWRGDLFMDAGDTGLYCCSSGRGGGGGRSGERRGGGEGLKEGGGQEAATGSLPAGCCSSLMSSNVLSHHRHNQVRKDIATDII